MQAQALQNYLHQHIPLSAAMDVTVLSADPDRVQLYAPLTPNLNHRATFFGGSASALAILAAWSLLHVRLETQGIAARLVIQRNCMDYQRPIAGDCHAVCDGADMPDWDPFLRMLERRGRGRVTVASRLLYQDRVAADFTGDFVALSAPN